jgi:hypothetical protein
MKWLQQKIELRARPRGFHLVTDEIVRAVDGLRDIETGFCRRSFNTPPRPSA